MKGNTLTYSVNFLKKAGNTIKNWVRGVKYVFDAAVNNECYECFCPENVVQLTLGKSFVVI